MKIFYRTNLPKVIKYNGRNYGVFESINTLRFNNADLNQYIENLKSVGHKVITVKVLQRNLKGRTDLHGNFYKPSEWFFVA